MQSTDSVPPRWRSTPLRLRARGPHRARIRKFRDLFRSRQQGSARVHLAATSSRRPGGYIPQHYECRARGRAVHRTTERHAIAPARVWAPSLPTGPEREVPWRVGPPALFADGIGTSDSLRSVRPVPARSTLGLRQRRQRGYPACELASGVVCRGCLEPNGASSGHVCVNQATAS